MTSVLLALLAFVVFPNPVHAQSMLTSRLQYGEHSVGFRVVQTVDMGRSYLPALDYFGQPTRFPRGRPMQVAMWYPAETGSRERPMQFGGYLGLSASDADFTRTVEAARQLEYHAFLEGYDTSARAAPRRLLDENTAVTFEAAMAAGDWPVVLYAPSLDGVFFDNSVLCEYLASKGYLVLSVTAKGEYTRLQSPTIRAVEVQVDDLAFLRQFATRFSKSEAVGTIGFSRGGLASLLFVTKNRDISAAVSLDGSEFSEGWLRDAAASPYFAPGEIQADLLMMTKNLRAPLVNPATFYDSATHADRTLIRFDHDSHGHFSSWALLQELVGSPSSVDASRPIDFYAELAEYVGDFLDGSLKTAPHLAVHARQRFPHAFRSDTAIRQMDPADVAFWIAELGIDYVARVTEDILHRDSEYLGTLRWRDLTAAADEAVAAGKHAEAVKILLLADRAMPGWYIVNERLAALYVASGNRDAAKEHYTKALRDNPRSEESREGLARLGAPVPALTASVAPTAYAKYLGSYGEGDRNAKEIFLREGDLYIGSATWDAPAKLIAYEPSRFLVQSEDPKANLQVHFEFDEQGAVRGIHTRGMNSGRMSELLLRQHR